MKMVNVFQKAMAALNYGEIESYPEKCFKHKTVHKSI